MKKKVVYRLALIGLLCSIVLQSVDALESFSDKVEQIGWRTLVQLDYQTGEAPARLQELQGKMVRLPGFIVPLEGENQRITEFLLVPSFGYCIHVPPPPPNQIIHIHMPAGIPLDLFGYPIWAEGIFKVERATSTVEETGFYVEASFVMAGTKVTPYVWE